MEKIFKISKLNKNPMKYNIETFTTPIKTKQQKYKENILNSFLQDTYNQNSSITRPNIPNSKITKNPNQDRIFYNQFIERKGKYDNNNNQKNNNKRYINNFIPIASFSGNKSKNNNNDNNKKYTILNPFRERSSSSSKSILIPTNENQISILKNSDNINLCKINIDNNSFVTDSNKKFKRNNTVYIKKHFSKEKSLKKNNNHVKINYNDKYIKKNNKKIKEDELNDYYYKSNKKNIPRANSSATVNKIISNSPIKQNTNNINSNVNIFNFDMQYNNAPNYFIKNSKMYNPYFNNYLQNNLNGENELNNFNNLLSIKNKKFKNNYNDNYNNEIIKLDNDDEVEINNNKNNQMEEQIFNQSAIIIQSVYRGCVIRFQINNLLKAYKGIEVLDHFFKYKYWKHFRNYLIMKSNILNNEIDSKMSISSISCISALFNTNKNFIFKSFNSKLLRKEMRESFFILNHTNKYSNISKYLDTFQNLNHIDNKNTKTIIWNKKKINNKVYINQNINLQKLPSKNFRNTIDINKEKILKNIIGNYLNHYKLYLLKYFMKFYFNGILNNKKESFNNNKNNYLIQDIEQIKQQKLLYILNNKELKSKKVLFNNFSRFYFKGLLNYMENNHYHMVNGGRLSDINENHFFIYKSKKNMDNNNENRNMNITLKIIRIFRKILLQNNKIKKESIKFYFYKFHLAGIFYFMKKELRKRIIKKKLFLENNINNNNNIIPIKDEGKRKNEKIKLLKYLINKNDKNNLIISKNVFDKWNLRTKIFSIIAIDKEKKKKRRIKKRNNKKLGSNNIANNPNNNINININTSNNSNKTNKKITNISCDTKYQINSKNKNIKPNFTVDHRESVIFLNNIKINDYFKINKFIQKIYCILSKKFYFFNLLLDIYKNKKKVDENEKNKINEDIDFFIEDSSEQSED